MKKYILILIVVLFLVSFVSSAPPVNILFMGDTGINVEVNIMPVYKFGEARFSVVHLFNATSGYQITNTTHDNINCTAFLRDSQGFEIMKVNAVPHEDHWVLNATAGGTTPVGNYAWTLSCIDGTAKVGGYASGYYEITITGEELTLQKTIIYISSLALMILLFIITLGVIPFLPSSDTKNKEGELIGISNFKYLRPILYGLSYLLLMAIMFISSNITLTFLTNSMVGDLFFKIYQIMFLLLLPIIVIWFIWIFYSIFQDRKVKSMLERGVAMGDI